MPSTMFAELSLSREGFLTLRGLLLETDGERPEQPACSAPDLTPLEPACVLLITGRGVDAWLYVHLSRAIDATMRQH
jgi:hypothetical protein